MFDLELMTQREDKALTVLLALTDQEHAATQTRIQMVSLPPTFEAPVRLLTGTGVTDPSTRPCFSISLWASFLDTPPWNHG